MLSARQLRSESHRRGAAAIEYALILPVMLLFVLGIMDAGRLLWTYTTLYRAAEAAARCAAINTTDCGTAAQIQSHAVAEAWGLTVSPSAFTVTTPSCGVQVRAAYDFTFIIPGLDIVVPLGTITLNATACYPL
jgi:Flp pilus assembly protein TadG